MNITIPEISLVVLIGASGSGKSTFARTHFKETEILSSDVCRGLVSDDENDQSATSDAFDVLHYIAAKRLAAGKMVVVDATNVQVAGRKKLIQLAREHHALLTAIVLNLSEETCVQRNANREDRTFGRRVIRHQLQDLRSSLRNLSKEGFSHIYSLSSPQEIAEVQIERQRLWSNLRHEQGPFDLIGDVHGCFTELTTLLENLGYKVEQADDHYLLQHPEGRRLLFLGDLVDRGPDSPKVLRLVMDLVKAGSAFCLPGNHDMKLHRFLSGKQVNINHGLEQTVAQLQETTKEFRAEVREFLNSLISHYVLDEGRLVIAHAGLPEPMHGRASRQVREFALYGETTGETDEFGLPIRYNWASEYRGKAIVVYGHTPIPRADWLNNTINIDTGCVFGGKLTALRYPEKVLVSVPAQRTYAEPIRPLQPITSDLSAQQQNDEILSIDDVIGKRIITVENQQIIVREENAIAALEVMSRFAVDPKWLVYLPPTMSPPETSKLDSYLEHPNEAFRYYQKQGVKQVICEEKHMGSRVVVVLCRSGDVARRRFGITSGEIGICYTRTGRRFFTDEVLEQAFYQRLGQVFEQTDFWSRFETDWVVLDCELLPWSVKAQSLLLKQYAAVGVAATTALRNGVLLLEKALQRGIASSEELKRFQEREEAVNRYRDAYRRYCWTVNSLDDLKLAPFHLLATEGKVYTDQTHQWHMETLASLCEADPGLLLATPYKLINLEDPQAVQDGIDWWMELVGKGGEGMVVKPAVFFTRHVQPAMKCRGPEYLRIIYGPDYDREEHLQRLRKRGVGTKRALASREFTLGIEALQRFVRQEPLRRVHECVFGVLAMESEPVDPRL